MASARATQKPIIFMTILSNNPISTLVQQVNSASQCSANKFDFLPGIFSNCNRQSTPHSHANADGVVFVALRRAVRLEVGVLVDMLMLKGRVVTAVALNCQREIAAKIRKNEGDYALALKGSQGNLYNDVQAFLDDPDTPLDTVETTDADHNRIEVRTASVSADIDWLQDAHEWPGLEAIGKIVSTQETGGKTSTETRYHPLSTAFPAARFNNIVRSHWAIENSLHWVLDVTMNEDQLRNRLDHGPENLAMLRHLALNVAKLGPSKGSMRGNLKRTGWNDDDPLELPAHFKRVESSDFQSLSFQSAQHGDFESDC
jgi:predicted transposase YbfD/YdcC